MSLPKSERMFRDYLGALRVRGLSPATLTSREQAVRRFLVRLGKRSVRAVTRADVESYAAALAGELGSGSRRGHQTALRSFFAWLETTDAVVFYPCVGVPLPKLLDRLPRRLAQLRGLFRAQIEVFLSRPMEEARR